MNTGLAKLATKKYGGSSIQLRICGNDRRRRLRASDATNHHTYLDNSHLLYVASCHTAGLWVVMRWPPWRTESNNDDKEHSERTSNSSSYPTPATNNSDSSLDWTAFTESRTLISTVLLTSGILLAVRFHRSYLRRIPDAPSISPSFLRRRTIFGKVTSVGDGDNFRIFHTPGGRLAGWGWLPWKKIPTAKKELKDNTVRLIARLPRRCTRLQLFDPPKLTQSPVRSDSHPFSRHRCPRTRTFRPPRATICPRSPPVAHLLPTKPSRPGVRLPPGSVQSCRG